MSTATKPILEPTWPLYTPADRIDVRGLDVAYRRKGEGDPVLFLHGLGMTRRWLPLYEELSKGCDLIAPEQPGCGDTPLPDWIYAFDDLVLHYAELCDALELETFHLVGYSFGGWLAAEFAAFFPERVRSLTLITPMGLRVPGHTPVDFYRLPNEKFEAAMFNGRADEFSDYLDEGEDTLVHRYAERTAVARVAWNPRYDFKLDRRLGRLHAPATVIAADDDLVVPKAQAERYAELLPQGHLVTVAGSKGAPTGHGIVAQAPQALAAEISKAIG